MIPHISIPPIFVKPKPKSINDLPEKPLTHMAVKLYLLGSLAWDYADTCVTIARNMRLTPTKKLCRAVRELKLEYDRFRNPSMRDESLVEESRLGLLFEEICETHFSRLNHGIASDKALKGLDKDYLYLVQSVHMAMAVLDAMKLYAAECDKWIRAHGVNGHSILSDHFRRLAILLPEFAGDCYNGTSEARRITAHILLNEIKQIEVCHKDGEA